MKGEEMSVDWKTWIETKGEYALDGSEATLHKHDIDKDVIRRIVREELKKLEIGYRDVTNLCNDPKPSTQTPPICLTCAKQNECVRPSNTVTCKEYQIQETQDESKCTDTCSHDWHVIAGGTTWEQPVRVYQQYKCEACGQTITVYGQDQFIAWRAGILAGKHEAKSAQNELRRAAQAVICSYDAEQKGAMSTAGLLSYNIERLRCACEGGVEYREQPAQDDLREAARAEEYAGATNDCVHGILSAIENDIGQESYTFGTGITRFSLTKKMFVRILCRALALGEE